MPYQKPPIICPVCKEKADFKFVQDYESEQGKWSLCQCSECQVQFWLPFKSPGGEQYEEEVDYSSKMAIMTKDNCWPIVRDYWNMNQFLKNLPHKNPKGKKLLDLACGTGEFLVVMQDLGYEVEGVDFNKNAIDFLQNKLGIKNVYQQDAVDFLEDKVEEYDVITAFEILEHLDQPKIFLELAYQALRPGGYFALSVPNRNRYFRKISPKIESWDFPSQHLTRWDSSSIKHFFENNHLNIIEIKKEIPVNWFVSRLRFLIELALKRDKTESFGPIERARENIGLQRYKSVKSFIKCITYPLASFLFYGLKFEGGGLYLLARK